MFVSATSPIGLCVHNFVLKSYLFIVIIVMISLWPGLRLILNIEYQCFRLVCANANLNKCGNQY